MRSPRVQKGDRIRLLYCEDSYGLEPGIEGVVLSVDAMGTVHVFWDDGGTLGLISGLDRWEKVIEPGG